MEWLGFDYDPFWLNCFQRYLTDFDWFRRFFLISIDFDEFWLTPTDSDFSSYDWIDFDGIDSDSEFWNESNSIESISIKPNST